MTNLQLLNSARTKAYLRLLPILMLCYVIAYVDRNNVATAKLTMVNDLPAFNERVFGFGIGIFFWGYFLLEIPGSLIVERWSANKWICRIMITWGLIAALTAFVTQPWHFYTVRFFLGLAEAGFFPGVIVYLTHWFPARDRSRVLAMFLIASPIAMMISPIISNFFLHYGTTETVNDVSVTYPLLFGFRGWQLVYLIWGLPAVLLGVLVPFILPDFPRHASWLTDAERKELETVLANEREMAGGNKHVPLMEALLNPKVLLLTLIYFGAVTANYGVETFLPSILKEWYTLTPSHAALLGIIPSILVLVGQLGVGFSSDYFQERRWHAAIPIMLGATAFLLAPWTRGNLWLTMVCFMVAAAGMKSYMPAFWSLPSLFLTSTAAAGSIGMINSFGNLGGFLGPTVLGWVKYKSNSYDMGLYFLAATSFLSAVLLLTIKLQTDTPRSPDSQ